ncbi:hypothetical protein BDV38DRAFT_249851 [Aspergillus pseudotamarii]|uniref:Secreted protein n=1 Tax=Aspergillus pseudotamarii TaxID=132259 RepID=A0A5N6SSF7_ASPPS|nr:uncharacterized protein BDV38DRAFT_249851 [Aspergillus pseudotamarii]KAE8136323.1 hypothetical protein BDV38DRAFT_249851 [Aspergillus pseudotamarii]
MPMWSFYLVVVSCLMCLLTSSGIRRLCSALIRNSRAVIASNCIFIPTSARPLSLNAEVRTRQ